MCQLREHCREKLLQASHITEWHLDAACLLLPGETKALEEKPSCLCSSACQLDRQRFPPLLSECEKSQRRTCRQAHYFLGWPVTCSYNYHEILSGGFDDDDKKTSDFCRVLFLTSIPCPLTALMCWLCLCRACLLPILQILPLHSSLAQGPVKLYSSQKSQTRCTHPDLFFSGTTSP